LTTHTDRVTAIPSRLLMEVTEIDPDYLRLDISIADGDFAGRVDVYEDPELPTTLAAAFRGFSSQSNRPTRGRSWIIRSDNSRRRSPARFPLYRSVRACHSRGRA
jgi:hypothetical protein